MNEKPKKTGDAFSESIPRGSILQENNNYVIFTDYDNDIILCHVNLLLNFLCQILST